ncbi:MAG TPA: hypothetical protein VGD81_03660 [Opitutaceae bacterium]
MARSLRYLICLPALLAASTLSAAPVFRTFSLGGDVSGLFYEDRGKPVALATSEAAFSTPYTRPPGSTLVLYRATPPARPGEKPGKVAVATVPLPPGDAPLLLLLAAEPATPAGIRDAPPQISALAVDDSPEAHPTNAFRVFNFSRRNTAVKLADRTSELSAGADKLFPPVEGNRVWIQVAIAQRTGWKRVAAGPRVVVPGARPSIFLRDVQPTPDNPDPLGLIVRTVFDAVTP